MLHCSGHASQAFRNLAEIENIIKDVDLGFIKIEMTSFVIYIIGKYVDIFFICLLCSGSKWR